MQRKQGLVILLVLLVLCPVAYLLFFSPDNTSSQVDLGGNYEEPEDHKDESPSKPRVGRPDQGTKAPRTETPIEKPTRGTIMGKLLVEVGENVPAVDEFTIYVEETRSALNRPKKAYPYKFSYLQDSGKFQIDKFPFGAWRILVIVPGMNSDEVTRILSAKKPVAHVTLKVEKGRNLVVNVHDHDRVGLTEVDVLLHPDRNSLPGRKTLVSKTDGLGNATFRNVITGKWTVRLGRKYDLLVKPLIVTLGPVHPKVVRLEVLQGGEVILNVLGPGGGPVPKATCRLFGLQTSRWREFVKTPDQLGVVNFGKVPPGIYQIRIEADGYQFALKTRIKVTKGEETNLTMYLKPKNR